MTTVKKLIEKGDLKYTHIYNETMTSNSVAHHIAKVPNLLKTLAKKNKKAKIVIYGDKTLGIDIDNKTWAVESVEPLFRTGKTLKKEIWQYISLALSTYPNSGWLDAVTND